MAKGKHKTQAPEVRNRRATFDYDITDRLEVGIKLQGSEVKAIRQGNVSIAEGFVRVQRHPPRLTLHGMNIGDYGPAGPLAHEPTRTRLLLAHKREIEKLASQSERKGVAIVPLRLYFKNGFAKLQIGVGTGRRKSDKRRAIADRDMRRDVERELSRRR